MNKLYTIGHIHGVPIKINLILIFVLVFVVFDASSNYYALLYPEFSIIEKFGLGVMTSLALFLSLLIHDFAHCLAAKLCDVGIKQVKMTIFGGIITFHGGFPTPRKELIVAFVGPWVSCHLSLACFLCSFVFYSEYAMWISDMFYWLGYVNVVIALFNLLPGYPLDGGMIISALIWRKTKSESSAVKGTCYTGYTFGALFMILGIISIIRHIIPLGALSFIVCWLFVVSSREALVDIRRRDTYSNYPISDILNSEYIPCYAYERIYKVARRVRGKSKDSVIIVLIGSEVIGTINRDVLYDHAHSIETIQSLMDPIDSIYASIEYPPELVYDIMKTNRLMLLPILDGERLLGFVDIDNVMSLFDTEYLGTYNTLSYSSM
ncbi:MAG: site-2 protease family protein [Dehalococcoidales bacterium]|nr:site-2 protease family protein [Dehalococcoidales bacterium]